MIPTSEAMLPTIGINSHVVTTVIITISCTLRALFMMLAAAPPIAQ
jgi:hypothetical protein